MPSSRRQPLNLALRFRYDSSVSACAMSVSDASCEPVNPEGERDMDVGRIGSAYGAYPVRSTTDSASLSSATSLSGPQPAIADDLHISTAGRMLEQTTDVRQQRLQTIRDMIDHGVYDTDARLEAALERMFDSWSD